MRWMRRFERWRTMWCPGAESGHRFPEGTEFAPLPPARESQTRDDEGKEKRVALFSSLEWFNLVAMEPKPHAALLIVGHGSTANPDSGAPTLAQANTIRE